MPTFFFLFTFLFVLPYFFFKIDMSVRKYVCICVYDSQNVCAYESERSSERPKESDRSSERPKESERSSERAK